jgi:hypothetical protein
MEKHAGLIEALEAFQEGHKHQFCMPAHSGRYINPKFKELLDRYGLKGIESSRRTFAKVSGYKYEDGVLTDMGALYH